MRHRLAIALAAASVIAGGLTVSQSADAAYPGGDGKIAFVRANQIYVINADGTGLKQLTTGAKNYRPKWSPNGQRIAYIHEATGGSKDIWVMSATGTNKNQVTHIGNVTEPTWSPDGKWLAFGADGVLTTIRSTAPFGGKTVPTAYETGCWDCPSPGDPNPGTETGPIPVDRFVAWSPDGNRIAVYNHSDAHLDDAMYWYYLGTGEARQIDAIGGDCCGYAEWSDLAWGPAGQFGYADIEYADEGPTSPLPSKVVCPGYVGKAGDTGPAPAPGNRRIAVTNTSSGTAKIFIQTVGGANRRQLTNGYQPDWQPRP